MTRPWVWVVVLLVAACAPEQDVDPPPDDRAASVMAMIEDGVVITPQQQEVLDRVAAGEPVVFDDYARLVEETIACGRDLGLEVEGPEITTMWGLPAYDWAWTDPSWDAQGPGPDDRTMLLGEDFCRTRHSLYVEVLYLNQPAAKEDELRQIDAYRPQLLECLEERGFAVSDPGMPIADLVDYVVTVADDSDWPDDGENCFEIVEVTVGP